MKILFRVVQPWGPDKAPQSTVISEHATAAKAFAEIDTCIGNGGRADRGAE